MDLKILSIILMYYMVLSGFFLLGGSYVGDSSFNGSIDSSNISSSEMDLGGVFGSGISFTRFVGLVTIGVGLPSDTPSFISTIFIIIQSCILIFTIGFIISSIWNG